MNYKIVIDSCGELPPEYKEDERFESVPLTLTVGETDVVDDDSFDQGEFLHLVASSPDCPRSACPSPKSYVHAYDCQAECVYVVTLSSQLSGSYNSAVLARDLFLEEHPQVKVHVFDSCSASVGETLIALKILECQEEGLSFEDTVEKVEAYIGQQHTFFVLENLETLRKNGRLSRVKGLVATALKIKPILGSTPEGNICQLGQARGMNKALVKMVACIEESLEDRKDPVLAISHCNCPQRAQMLKEVLLERLPLKKVWILDTGGVSSMYANDGGVIVVV